MYIYYINIHITYVKIVCYLRADWHSSDHMKILKHSLYPQIYTQCSIYYLLNQLI